jgi:hypothetical protein
MFGYVFSDEIQHFLLAKEFLEVKLPTIWTDGKAEVGRIREEKSRREKRRERVRRKKMQAREKVKVCEILCFSHGLWLRRVGK